MQCHYNVNRYNSNNKNNQQTKPKKVTQNILKKYITAKTLQYLLSISIYFFPLLPSQNNKDTAHDKETRNSGDTLLHKALI